MSCPGTSEVLVVSGTSRKETNKDLSDLIVRVRFNIYLDSQLLKACLTDSEAAH